MAGKGKISNIFVWIILILLIVGLAGFGVGNFGGSVRSVASVGETEIDINTYARGLQTELNAIQQRTGENMTLAQAQALQIDRVVLQQLLSEAALEELTRVAGISVGDENVSEQVLSIQAFRGLDGEFDREAYEYALERNNTTIAQFEDSIRADLARNLLQSAMVGGITPGQAYSDAIYGFVGEERTISYARLTASDLDTPPSDPTAAEIRAFYDDNPDQFTLPERRKLTFAWLSPETLLDSVEVEETSLRDAYEARIDEFVVPERRMVERLVFPDDAAAQAASDAIAAGESTFEEATAARNLTPEDIDLGVVTAEDLGEAADRIFALGNSEVSGPLPSTFGPALFRVNAVLNAQETSFEDARAILREDLARTAAERMINDEIEPLDDLLAGGATLEELVAESDMVLETVEWSGDIGEGLFGYASFLDRAATVTADDFPEIVPLEDGGIFALRLDEVLPPALQSFEDVSGQAGLDAADKATRDALTSHAEAQIEALSGGSTFSDLDIVAETVSSLPRQGIVPGLPEDTVSRVFELSEGESLVIEDGGDIVLLQLDRIQPPDRDAPAAEGLLASLDQEAQQAMALDVLEQAARAVQLQTGITINQAALNAVHAQMP